MTRKNAQGLTDKQAAFVREYAIDHNATQAAIRAGYAPNTAKLSGHNCITNPYVQAAFEAITAKSAARVAVTLDSFAQECDDMIAEARKGNPVTDRYGNPTGEHIVAFSGWGKGLELKGKAYSLLTERRDVTTHNVSSMGIADLKAQQAQLVDELRSLGLDEHGKPLDHQTTNQGINDDKPSTIN